jgi:hypothetical protein
VRRCYPRGGRPRDGLDPAAHPALSLPLRTYLENLDEKLENAIRETAQMGVLVQRRRRWGDLAGARVRRSNGLMPRARRASAGV